MKAVEVVTVGLIQGAIGWVASATIQASVDDRAVRNIAVPAVWISVIILGGIFLIVRLGAKALTEPANAPPSKSTPTNSAAASERDTLRRQLVRAQDTIKQFRGDARQAKQRAQAAENQLAELRRDYETARGREQAVQADATRMERYQHAVKALVTWLYRRDNWGGLTTQGRVSEAAPWREYARPRYSQFGLENEPYERTNNVHPEPGWDPPRDRG